MTISKKAVYGGHREQVLQDIAANIDVLQGFIADQKAKLLATAVNFQFTADGAEPDIIDMVVAENAAASIHQLVIAEINGGYRYADVVRDDDDDTVAADSDEDEDVKGSYEDLVAKRDALVAQESARKAKRARKARRAA